MSHAAFAKRTAQARRYPRRTGKKDSYVFRAGAADSHIAFIPEDQADRPAGRKR